MSEIERVAREYLEKQGWFVRPIEPVGFEFIVPGPTMRWIACLSWDKDGHIIYCFSQCPMRIPADRLAAAAEYTTRVNYMLADGQFDLDWKDGTAAMLTSASLKRVPIDKEALEELLGANFSHTERWMPGLIAVISGYVSPERAVADIQRHLHRQAEGTRAKKKRPSRSRRTKRTPEDDAVAESATKAVTRMQRVQQIADLLRRMHTRAHKEAKESCFASLTSPAHKRAGRRERTIQFCFERKWFAVDLPNSYLTTEEAVKLLRQRRGFYREAERPDAGVTTDVQELVDHDPVGKKYIYGDEREAAEDAAFILFDLWALPAGERLLVTASSFEGCFSWEKDAEL